MNRFEKWVLQDPERLRSCIEQPIEVGFWGEKHVITPRLIEHVIGDGRLIQLLQPLSTRPNLFYLRVDSSEEYDIRDHLDEIFDAAEDQFGRYIDPEDRETDDEYSFPIADWCYGCCWDEPGPFRDLLDMARGAR